MTVDRHATETFDAADAAAQHAGLAAIRLEAASSRLHDTEQRQLGQILIDHAHRRAELDIQRAQASALLAIAHGLEALRAEMVETRDVIDNALFDIANPLAPPPRWWQWRRWRALHRQTAACDEVQHLLDSDAAGADAVQQITEIAVKGRQVTDRDENHGEVWL